MTLLSKPPKRVDVGDTAGDNEGCKELASVLAQIGDKWIIMVVGVLSLSTSRFNALQRNIPGISHRMLTMTLRGLERDGLVKRTAFAEIPPRVEYNLTSLGRSLGKPLSQLAEWAALHRPAIEESRSDFDSLQHNPSQSDQLR